MILFFNEYFVEMGVMGNEKCILKCFEGSEYWVFFEVVYGDDIFNLNNIVKVFVSYVRSLVLFNSVFDNYVYV